MDKTIQSNYEVRAAYARSCETKQSGTPNRDFLRMTAQYCASQNSAASATAVSERADMSMEAYRQMIREKIAQMPLSDTRQMESISVQISDAAFERMKNDPDYEAWVLNDLQTAFAQTNPWVPVCGGGYSVFYIGETKEECHAEGWYAGYKGGQGENLFAEKAEKGFWEKRMENHQKMMEIQEKAAAKRRMMMKLRMNGSAVSAADLLMGLL